MICSVLVYGQGAGGKWRQPDRKWPPEHSARGREAIVCFYTSVICCLFLHIGDRCCLFFHLNLVGDLFDLNLCAVKGCLSLSPPLSAHCE